MEPKNSRYLRDHVVVVDRARGPARALSPMLEASGYVVMWMSGVSEVIAYCRDLQPNLILLGTDLGAADVVHLCGTLRDPAVLGSATPLVLVGPLSSEERLAAFAAGAWECLVSPYNLEEVSARLAAFVAATREARHLRTQGLVAQVTGFSTHAALVRRVREMSGQAIRTRSSVACVVISASAELSPTQPEPDVEVLARTARALRRVSRASDVLGFMGNSEFVILMPAAGDSCAIRVAERALTTMEHAQFDEVGARGWQSPLRAGYCVFPDAAIASSEWGVIAASMADPAGLIGRARQAARAAHLNPERSRLRRYSDNGGVRRATPADGLVAPAEL